MRKLFGDVAYRLLWPFRYTLCNKPYTPSFLLRRFADSNCKILRYNASANPNTPADAIVKMIKDKNCNPFIIFNLAENENTPPEGFELLVDKEDPMITEYLLANNSLPDYLKEYISSKRFVNSYDLSSKRSYYGQVFTESELLISGFMDFYRL